MGSDYWVLLLGSVSLFEFEHQIWTTSRRELYFLHLVEVFFFSWSGMNMLD